MLQVWDTVIPDEDPDKDEFLQDILKVFAAKRKRCMDKASELSAPCLKTPAPALTLVVQAPTADPSHS